jgi:hypothetical protein
MAKKTIDKAAIARCVASAIAKPKTEAGRSLIDEVKQELSVEFSDVVFGGLTLDLDAKPPTWYLAANLREERQKTIITQADLAA